MSEPPNYAVSPFASQVHNPRPERQFEGASADEQRGIRAKFVESIIQIVVSAFTGVFIPGGLGTAFDQLTDWVQNILPEEIKAPLGQLVDLLVDILDSIPIIGPPIGDAVEDLAALFGVMRDTTANAQDSANTALAGLASLKARIDAGTSGALFVDTFDRVQDLTEDGLGPDWVQTYSAGSGTLGVEGGGTTFWSAAGTTVRTCVARTVAETNTENQILQMVAADKPASFAGLSVGAEMGLFGRAHDTNDDWIEAIIGFDYCLIAVVLGGAFTQLASTGLGGTDPGDLWEFHVGIGDGSIDADDPYTCVLYQNNNERLRTVDSSHIASMGLAYRHGGFIESAAASTGFFQYKAPAIQVVTMSDRPI